MKEEHSGKLYIVSTPIGNLKDITFRAIEVLNSVDFILAEDTRRALKLLNHYDISKRVESFFAGNEWRKKDKVIGQLLQGESIALITDSGTPCISDPGNTLVDACNTNGIRVEPIPGPSAFVTALSISGISSNPSLFVGFLPKSNKKRNNLLDKIKDLEWNVILYESPHRLKKTLLLLRERMGNIKIYIFKELTKVFESSIINNIDNVLENLDDNIKGEYVIIFNPKIY